MSESVPLLNIAAWYGGSDAQRHALASEIDNACRDWGFLVLAGHSVDFDLIAQMQSVSRAFFDLPLDEKEQVAAGPRVEARGYRPMEATTVARTRAGGLDLPDLKESFRIGPEAVPGENYFLQPGADRYFRPNVWPAVPTKMREIWTRYWRACDRLCQELMQIFALALGLPREWFQSKIDHSISPLVAVNYPGLPNPPRPGQLRSAPHTDFGSVTLLLTEDKPGGLQVLDRNERWCDVQPLQGAYIVNLGDLMAQWTNDRWRSTVHRVVNPPHEPGLDSRRQSIVFFHQPNHDAVVECIPTCRDAAHPARYTPVNSGEHLRRKLTLTLGDKPNG